MKKLLTKALVVTLFSCLSGFAQSNPWTKVISDGNTLQRANNYAIKNLPKAFNQYTMQFAAFTPQMKAKNSIILLPNGNGQMEKFRIRETSNFEEGLSKKFPMISSYTAQGIDDPTAVAKISVGTDGFHAAIFAGGKSTVYIDPITKDNNTYMVYKRSALGQRAEAMTCDVDSEVSDAMNKYVQTSLKNADDGKLRTYRIAVVTSGGYSQFHLTNQGVSSGASDAVKKAAVISAINTTMTRVNGVYEKDLGVRMVLVANNDEVVFLDANTDGISDGNASAMINQVQTICDNVIGSANYDIGHVFSIAGSGLAGLGVVCRAGQKARGVTGIGVPLGDPYDIDYVSHEIGHQFGANHTQNNSCNRNNATAVEPGSASTIMGYAGICAPNVQNNSDDHFHAVNITEMWNYTTSTATCAVETNTGNNTPTANAGADMTIPKSTPFVLRGVATDADGMSSLTYNWEQIDNEIGSMPPSSTNTQGPMFRSLSSKTSPNRYMPDLATVIGGATQSTWEVVPSVARTMEFSFLVRDNHPGGGNSARDDMIVTVDAASGPFVVTSQTTNETWDVGSSQTVTWDVAGTNTGSVNTPTVNILLSTDGGASFPITVASNIANDGSHTFSVPAVGGDSSQVRVMVEGNGNIFYAVNSSNFSINESEFAISLDAPIVDVCAPANAVYTFTYNTFLGFNGTTTFGTSGLPGGLSASFSPTTATADGTQVTMTVSGTGGVAAGSYAFTVTGTSGSIVRNASAGLNIFDASIGAPTLTFPSNGATDVAADATLTWSSDINAESYLVEIATDNGFSNTVVSTTVTSNSYTTSLSSNTTYFWRITPSNQCGSGTSSAVFSYTTANLTCNAFDATDVPITITTAGNVTYESKINVAADYPITDVNVTINIPHTFTADLDIFLISPAGTRVELTTDNGSSGDNYTNTVFDQEASNPITGGSPPFTGTYTPEGNLASLYGEMSGGEWTLEVTDDFSQDGGSIERFTLELCVQGDILSNDDLDTNLSNVSVFPNPTRGNFNVRFSNAANSDVFVRVLDLSGRTVFQKNYTQQGPLFAENIVLNRIASGMYLVQIQSAGKQTTKKLILE